MLDARTVPHIAASVGAFSFIVLLVAIRMFKGILSFLVLATVTIAFIDTKDARHAFPLWIAYSFM